MLDIGNNHYVCPFHCIAIYHHHVSEHGHSPTFTFPNRVIQTSAHGGTGSFAAGGLSSKRQIYLLLMPKFWQISSLYASHHRMSDPCISATIKQVVRYCIKPF